MGLLDTVGKVVDIVKMPFDIGSSLVNANQQKQAQLRQNRINQQNQELEFKRNLEMWNLANQYNSPKAQMQRYSDAGLNPNLIYGQGTSGNTSTLPKYTAPERRSSAFVPDFTQVLSQYQDMRIKNAQIKGLEADANVKNVNATFAYAMNEAKLWEMRRKGEISEVTYRRLSQELKATWGDDFGVYWKGPKTGMVDMSTNLYDKMDWQKKYREGTAAKLEQASTQVALGNVLKGIRENELNFLQSGGKYFNPFIQFMKLIFNR